MSPRYLTLVVGACFMLSAAEAAAKPPIKTIKPATPTQQRASHQNQLEKGQGPKTKRVGVEAKKLACTLLIRPRCRFQTELFTRRRTKRPDP